MDEDDIQANSNNIVEAGLFDYWARPEQYPENSPQGRFTKLAALPDDQIDLAEAALIISAQEYTGLDEVYYLDQLDNLADEVRPLLSTQAEPIKNIEHLNYFLTTIKGFHGNESDYNNRQNSYLSDVLQNRTGIPITLSLLYIELGKRLGLHFEGIGLPGHFIIRYRQLASQTVSREDRFNANQDEPDLADAAGSGATAGSSDILLDPFNGGNILTEEECIELVRERYGRVVPLRQAFTRPVTNRQFLTRMLNNLKAVCVAEEDFERALEVQENLVMLNLNDLDEKRDRGILYLRNERYGRAIMDLQAYLRQYPEAADAATMRSHLNYAFDKMSKRN